MYDAFSADYDRFVSWPARLDFELPFIQAHIRGCPSHAGRPRVLDAACGTGWHAIALAQRGCQAVGADLSAPMVQRARHNAAEAGVQVRFEAAGFGALADTFGRGAFDALLCLGNSLPHLLSLEGLQAGLADFAACLAPGGVLLLQNRNFDALATSRARWMEPQAHRAGEAEWLFLRFYDYDPDGLITFNVVSLHRQGEQPWGQQVHSTRLRPLLEVELVGQLERAGFEAVTPYGSLGGEPFDPSHSGNLVVVAVRQSPPP